MYCLGFTVHKLFQLRLWKHYMKHPNDPTLSCYQTYNQTWICAEDVELQKDFDAEDSY